jgi:hypothetical protein
MSKRGSKSKIPFAIKDEPKELPSNSMNFGVDNAKKFDVLIDTVLTNFSESQLSIQELMKLKDELLMHYLPPPLLFQIAVVFGQVFRTFSDLNTSVFEMLRLVKIYSSPWEKNSAVLKKLHDMYENKKQMLNIAIKRLAAVDKRTKLFAKDKRISNWERVFIKLSEAKGHGRRWKFQMETFRKKADRGYEELIKWVTRDPAANTENNFDQEDQEESSTQRVRPGARRTNRGQRSLNKDDDLFDEDNLSLNDADEDERKKEDVKTLKT